MIVVTFSTTCVYIFFGEGATHTCLKRVVHAVQKIPTEKLDFVLGNMYWASLKNDCVILHENSGSINPSVAQRNV